MFVRRYRTELLIAVAALAIAAGLLPLRFRFPFDDTFITFRYAQNLAHGFGIVWNPGGAHTEGYTNFLFMLLLVPVAAMGWDLVSPAQWIGVISVAISAIALYRMVAHALVSAPGSERSAERIPHTLSTRSTPPWALLAAALFLFDPYTWSNAFSGMETSFFVMWVLLVFLAISEERTSLAFALSTLAALTRPEGALLGIIILAVTGDRRRAIRPFLLHFVLPLALYAGWKWWYFGSPLPNSFYVKVAHRERTGPLPGLGNLLHFYLGLWPLALPVVLSLRLAVLSFRDWKGARAVGAAVLWSIGLTAFYLMSQLLMDSYLRFTMSLEAAVLFFTAVGIGTKWPRLGRSACVLYIVALTLTFCGYSLYVRGAWGDFTRDTTYEDRYRALAAQFRSIPGHERITLAWADAGILPYYSGLRNIDLAGLNSNAIAHARTPGEVISYVLSERPDLVFIPIDLTTGQPYGQGHGLIGASYAALRSQAFAAGYRPIAVIPQ